jgi:hypothetical protein
MVSQRAQQSLLGRLVDRLAKVDAHDFGAERGMERCDV